MRQAHPSQPQDHPDDASVRPARETGRLAGAATALVVAGSGVAGLAAYGFQILGTRSLGDAGYAPVGVLWTVQFLLFSILLHPIETWVARVSSERGKFPERRALAAAVGWAIAVLLVLCALAVLGRRALFDPTVAVAFAVPLVGFGYLVYCVGRGLLAGSGRYASYAVVTAAESLIRLVAAAVLVLAVEPTALGLALVLPIGAVLAAGLAFVIAGLTRPRADLAGPAGPVDDGDAGRFLLPVGTANIAAQTLLAGGPILLAVVGTDPAKVAVAFVVLTVARAPLVFGYGGLLSRVLPPLVAMVRAGDEAGLRRAAVGVVAAAGLLSIVGGATAAGVAGPLTGAVFGGDFVAPRVFAGLAVAGCLLAAGNLLLGQVLIASRLERRLVAPWWAGLAVAVSVVLLLPGDPLLLTGVGLTLGEIVAGGGLLLAVYASPSRSA